MASDMRVVCAWCQRIIREGTLPATHTICPACYRDVFKVKP